MAVDISIENFAFVLFRKLWIRRGLCDVKDQVNSYPEIPASETEYSDEIMNTVYLRQVLSHFFYEQLLDTDYQEFSTSRSDFHSYFTSGCDHISAAGLHIMEELLATAAFVSEMGVKCASDENFAFAHSCPLSWAMHFDCNLKEKFYESGGWAAFREYSAAYEKTSTFVMSFGVQYNVYEQLEQYLDYFYPKLMSAFSGTDAEEWKRKCTALKIALNPVTDNSKGPLIDSEKFAELMRLPSLLSVLSEIPVLDVLSINPAKKLSYYDESRLRCGILENVEKTTSKNSRPSFSDSTSNTCGRDKSKFMSFFSIELDAEESKAMSSRPAGDLPFPAYQSGEQTEANSGTDDMIEIFPLPTYPLTCSVSMDSNSSKKTQFEDDESKAMVSILPDNVSSQTSQSKEQTSLSTKETQTESRGESESLNCKLTDVQYYPIYQSKNLTKVNCGTDSTNETLSQSSKIITSASEIVPTANDFVHTDSKQNEVKLENKEPDLSKASELIKSIDSITRAVNERLSLSNHREPTVPKSMFSTITTSYSKPNYLKQNVKQENKEPDLMEASELTKSIDHITRLVNEHLFRNDLGALTAPKSICPTIDSTSYSRPIVNHEANTSNSYYHVFPNLALPDDPCEVFKTPQNHEQLYASINFEIGNASQNAIDTNLTKTDDVEHVITTDPIPDNFLNQTPGEHDTEAKTPGKTRKQNKSKKNESSQESEANVLENLITEAHLDIDGGRTDPISDVFSNQTPGEHVSKTQTPSKTRKRIKSKKNKSSHKSKASALKSPSTIFDPDEDGYSTDPAPDRFSNQTPCELVTKTKSPIKRRQRNKDVTYESSRESEASESDNPSSSDDPDEDGTERVPENFSNQKPCEQVTQARTPIKSPKMNKGKLNKPSLDFEPSIFENPGFNLDATFTQDQIREIILRMLLVLGTF